MSTKAGKYHSVIHEFAQAERLVVIMRVCFSPSVLSLAFITVATQTFALTTAEKDLVCPQLGALAIEIMARRQEGVAMSTVIVALKNDDPTADTIVRNVIEAAYAEPQYQTESMKNNVKNEFRNKIEFGCYSSKP